MSIPGAASPLFLATTAAGPAGDFSIARSLRFNSGDSANLSKTFGSASNRKTFTFSCWVKKSASSASNPKTLFGVYGGSAATSFTFRFDSSTDDTLRVENNFAVGAPGGRTQAVFRDYSGWMHVVLSMDTRESGISTGMKIYVNGVEQSLQNTVWTQDVETLVNSTNAHYIGSQGQANSYFDGYLAEINFVDGQALDPTSFGAFDDNGVWQAKDTAGLTFGTNGFRLKFTNNSSNAALGTDSSGSSNTWTVNNLSAGVGTAYSSNGSGGTGANKGYAKAFDGSLSTFCEPSDNSTVTFDFTGFSGGGIAVSSSLRMYLNKAGSPAAGHFTVNGTNLGGSLPSGAWLTIGSVSSLQTITFFHASGSSSVELYAVEVDSTILVDGTAAGQDSLIDSPSNAAEPSDSGVGNEVIGNYATLNPLQKSSGSTLTNGNLDISMSGSQGTTFATMPFPASGKWYFECTANSSQGDVGIAKASADLSQYVGKNSNSYGYYIDGNVYHNDSSAGSGASYGNGDIIGVAFDSDAGTCKWYKNNALQVTISSLTGEWFPAFGSGNAAGIFNFGSRAFSYTAPSNHKSLNTANLPTPTIADGSKYFDTKLYDGNSGSQAITMPNSALSPDLVWIKNRNGGHNHMLFDIVRGAGADLQPNSTATEGSAGSNDLTSFDSNGFSLGSNNAVNQSSRTYVSWNWDAGTGSPVTNNDGSIASQVRAQPSAGFSIVAWSGQSGTNTVGHGLNAAPELIILKGRNNAGAWVVGSDYIGWGNRLELNGTGAASPASADFNSTAPTSSVFTAGSNQSSGNKVAYCFAPVAGYSAVGSYTNPSSSDAAFVYLGFRPAFLIIRCAVNISSSSGSGDWLIKDTTRSPSNNPSDGNNLVANVSAAEDSHYSASQAAIDILSNGFKIRHPNSSPGGDPGRLYLFYAVAENPFQANGGLAR